MNTNPQHELYEAGSAAGEAAASWVEIDASNAQRILDGIDNCDPEIMDMIPSPLSGEWAGESLTELGLADASDDELYGYGYGYEEGYWDVVAKRCQYHLAP